MIVLGGEGRNLSALPDAPRRACWELQGEWGKYLGTPVNARWFITAAHVGGQPGDVFRFGNQSYTTILSQKIPQTDIVLWRVDRAFPRWATLCDGDDVGREALYFGRGTARGLELPGKGWRWGPIDHKQSWGTNKIERVFTSKPYGELLFASFDKNAGPDEATLSDGDSGGGVFIEARDGQWKLAGLNHDINPGGDGIDRFYSTTGRNDDLFRAALYDSRGLFLGTPEALKPLSGNRPLPTLVAAQRLSTYLPAIHKILARPDSAWPTRPALLETRLAKRGGAALAGVSAIGAVAVYALHRSRRRVS